ncbi:uncharacterized protein [Epargyreus clarus]|uniref:uncharacterized protein isoform X2 n=1 Tax=Epargyreus clarus TaxID=520877 RepID=UPI003C2F1E49
MAKKKQELFIDIYNEKELDYMLGHNLDRLICAEIYNSFSGYCTALNHLFIRIKLDWSDGKMVLLRVLADEIESLKRFHNQSEPIYIFIVNRKITRVFQGVDNIRFADAAKEELHYFKLAKEGEVPERRTYDIDEPSEEEIEWQKIRKTEVQQEAEMAAARIATRQAARKQHRAELMVPHLQHLNFVLYWPHAKHAHPELYERWNMNNIIMVGREEIQLTKEMAEDILYAGDAPINEASMFMLLSAPALAICFRLLDAEKNFVSIVRNILYEEVAALDDSKPLDEQLPIKTAFDLYKTFSPSREEVWQKRREERVKEKEKKIEQRARRLSEMQRMARQAIEDQIEAKRVDKERRKLELLKAGDLSALEKLRNEPEDLETDIIVPEELSDEEAETISDIEDENEYLPPAGLLIPGFYAPPNDIAKVNGLAVLFPKIVAEYVLPEEEFLPPHVLVLIDMLKRYKAVQALIKYKDCILHVSTIL